MVAVARFPERGVTGLQPHEPVRRLLSGEVHLREDDPLETAGLFDRLAGSGDRGLRLQELDLRGGELRVVLHLAHPDGVAFLGLEPQHVRLLGVVLPELDTRRVHGDARVALLVLAGEASLGAGLEPGPVHVEDHGAAQLADLQLPDAEAHAVPLEERVEGVRLRARRHVDLRQPGAARKERADERCLVVVGGLPRLVCAREGAKAGAVDVAGGCERLGSRGAHQGQKQ